MSAHSAECMSFLSEKFRSFQEGQLSSTLRETLDVNQASGKDFLQVIPSRSRTAASLAEGQTRSGGRDEI